MTLKYEFFGDEALNIPQNDFLTQLMVYLTDNQIPGLERIKEAFNRLRKNHNKSVLKHLGFGSIDRQIETKTFSTGQYFGELNSNNQEHGKGVIIYNCSKCGNSIIFALIENDNYAEGNYIIIFESGQIQVGEIYFKNGKKKKIGTSYEKDGTSDYFDQLW